MTLRLVKFMTFLFQVELHIIHCIPEQQKVRTFIIYLFYCNVCLENGTIFQIRLRRR
jgi:hypothetical protein